MKRFLAVLLSVFLLAGVCACGGKTELPPQNQEPDNPEPPKTEETILEYDKYNLETYIYPYWEGNIVYNETLLFVGKDDMAPLMFSPEEILSVRSYDLKTEYVEGIDYIVRDGCICLTENTSIPYFEETEYYPLVPEEGKAFGCTEPGHPFILFGEGDTFCSRQIAVTYKHNERFRGQKPLEFIEKYARFRSLLEAGEEADIVFYGDSIATGANSSGVIGVEPFAPGWPQMFADALSARYPEAVINTVNTAVGGMKTQWGVDNVKERCTQYDPDLAVICFGANDPDMTADVYYAKMKELVEKVKADCPNAEIMLVSTFVANKVVVGFYGNQYLFEDELLKIAQERADTGVISITTVEDFVLSRKRFCDITGNNVNHPSDFFARMYVQSALASMFGVDYADEK